MTDPGALNTDIRNRLRMKLAQAAAVLATAAGDPNPENIDWSELDHLLDAAEKHQISLLGLPKPFKNKADRKAHYNAKYGRPND